MKVPKRMRDHFRVHVEFYIDKIIGKIFRWFNELSLQVGGRNTSKSIVLFKL
jgi:hypothetical protein